MIYNKENLYLKQALNATGNSTRNTSAKNMQLIVKTLLCCKLQSECCSYNHPISLVQRNKNVLIIQAKNVDCYAHIIHVARQGVHFCCCIITQCCFFFLQQRKFVARCARGGDTSNIYAVTSIATLRNNFHAFVACITPAHKLFFVVESRNSLYFMYNEVAQQKEVIVR